MYTTAVMLASGLIGVVLLIAYLMTRRNVLRIRSSGDCIEFYTSGASAKSALGIMDLIESAKNDRYLLKSQVGAANFQSTNEQVTVG